MRDPQNIARTWYNKAEGSEDPYDRFICLWFAFNALYNEFFQESERDAIYRLVYSNRYRLSNKTMNNILNSPYVEFFKQRIVRDCRRGSGRDTSESAAVLRSNSFYPKDKLYRLLKILYQVRCNLFHGDKIFGKDSDDQVVSNAAGALEEIIKAYLFYKNRNYPS